MCCCRRDSAAVRVLSASVEQLHAEHLSVSFAWPCGYLCRLWSVLRSTFLRERHVVIPRDPAVTALDSAAGRRIRNGVLIREALDQVLERNDG
jgi:hypothetical protein